ncbi:MAG TPA: hypothetical protein VKR22_08625 [Acidimicrobiales bacterium]|nr:hypothetical protein [Acidimicrobiales bacterium]
MYVDDTATGWSSWTNLVAHVLFPRIVELSLAAEAMRSSHVAGRGLQ